MADEQKKGDLVRAGWLNSLAQKVERFAGIRVASPLSMSKLGGTPSIGLPGGFGGSFYAQLTDRSGVAYGWREVYLGSDKAWHFLLGGRSGTPTSKPAYEVNYATDLLTSPSIGYGEIVQLTLGFATPRDYRFVFNRLNGGCGSTHNTICVRAVGCSGTYPIVGASVTIAGPNSETYTVQTPATGSVCVAVNSFGTYTVTVDASTATNGPGSRFTSLQTTVTFPNGTCGQTKSLVLNMPRQPGYQCLCCQTFPLPTSLTLVDKYGSHTLQYSSNIFFNDGTGVNVYEGYSCEFTATYNGASYQRLFCNPDPRLDFSKYITTTCSGTFRYDLICYRPWIYTNNQPLWWLVKRHPHLAPGADLDCSTVDPTNYLECPTQGLDIGSPPLQYTVSGSQCPPFNAQYSFSGVFGPHLNYSNGYCDELADTVSIHE